MNDFQQLCNTAVYYDYQGISCQIHQVKIKDLAIWIQAIEQLPSIESLFDIIRICTSLDQEELLSQLDEMALAELVQCIFKVNAIYFESIEKPQQDGQGSWFDSVQLLIHHGHSLDCVLNMGLGQFMGFVSACQKRQHMMLLNQLHVGRLAHHGAKKDIEAFEKVLGY